MTMHQFDKEQQKTFGDSIHGDKVQIFTYTTPTLSLMGYSNYTELQYKFSKTYRSNPQNHREFYHLGKYLKMSVKEFGTPIHKGTVKSFYHGIGEKLVLPSCIGVDGVLIYCPLSTSSSLHVAINFTNENAGLVVEFGTCFDAYSAKCFSVSWLSDYASEQE
eukprot:74032_1